MRADPTCCGLSQLSEADGSLNHPDGLTVPMWARGALTPRTPRDVLACSTQAGDHSPPPRQQHAEHFVASLRPILELSAESHFKASGRRLLHPAQRLMDLAQAGLVRLSSAGSVLRRVLTQAFSHRLE